METLSKRHFTITAVTLCVYNLFLSENIIIPALQAFNQRLTCSNLKSQSWDQTAYIFISK